MEELTHEKEVCLALGYFDSVHLGHRRIISATRELAEKLGLKCAVATFSNNAYKVFNRDEKTVYTYAERCELFDGLTDYVVPMRFDAHLKNMPATEFLDKLFSRGTVKAVVCGYDYLFGAGAKGDAMLLKEYCERVGVQCVVVDKFELDGVRVSTTVIKERLAAGDIEEANKLLGEPFFVSGKVVHGRGAGRMFDIPTANIKLPIDKLLPKVGVYGTKCVVDGKEYDSVTNVGGRPTFGLTKTVVETMIKDFSDNIYDKTIKVSFHKYLRSVSKFDTPAQLSKQVHKDLLWSV